jgi:hypothetical protein
LIISCTASQTRKAISSVKFDISLEKRRAQCCEHRRIVCVQGLDVSSKTHGESDGKTSDILAKGIASDDAGPCHKDIIGT